MQLFDHGLTRPIQQHLLAERRDWEEHLAKAEESAAKLESELDQLGQQLEKTEAISAAELSALRTQQRLLAVDLAGVKGRIEAANKLLADREHHPTRSQIENVKIAAEIELAGLAARQKTLDEIIQQARRLQLPGSRTAIQRKLFSEQGVMRQHMARISRVDELLERFQPFPLRDGKITIQPIKWDEP